MSGRLVILSKKGYCPWNEKNLARIERDEKAHREAQEKEAKKQAALASRERLLAMKNPSEKVSVNPTQQERFSLFEESVGGGESFCQELNPPDASPKQSDRIRPPRKDTFGAVCSSNQTARKPFYLAARTTEKSLGWKEMSRKQEMDPMRQFQVKVGTPEFVIHQAKQTASKASSHDEGISSWGEEEANEIRKHEKRDRKRKRRDERNRSRKHSRSSRSKKKKKSRRSER